MKDTRFIDLRVNQKMRCSNIPGEPHIRIFVIENLFVPEPLITGLHG
jgi:hypothetical protein